MGKGLSITKIKGIKSKNLKSLIQYITNPEKTDEKAFVSTINCNQNTALTEFQLAKEKYLDAKDEILPMGYKPNNAFHLIQSFKGSDYDPALINQIGKEFAEELLNNNFQCIIATHLPGKGSDAKNIHNHIVFNAYSFNSIAKYHDKHETFERMREINDKICLKYGLEILTDIDKERTHSYKEWLEIKEGTSWKEQIREDIKSTMQITNNWDDYKSYMESAGYIITQNSRSVTYQVPASELKVRDTKLGREFTKSSLNKYWLEEELELTKQKKLNDTMKVNKKETLYVSRKDITGRERSLLEIMILKAIKKIKNFFKLLTEEEKYKNKDIVDKKVQNLIDTIAIANNYNIKTPEDLDLKLNEVGADLSHLTAIVKSQETEYDNIRELFDEIKDLEVLKLKISSANIDYNDLVVKDFSESDIKRNKALLNPPTSKQKIQLFKLMEEQSFYKLKYKFDELSKTEATEVIDFIIKTKKNPEDNIKIPESIYTIDEFNLNRLKKKYEATKIKRFERMKEQFKGPITEAEKNKLNLLLKSKKVKIDTSKLSKYDYIRINNYFNMKNPLKEGFEKEVKNPIKENIKQQIDDLLKIYPEEKVEGIDISTLDNSIGLKLYNYLMEKETKPELFEEKNSKEIKFNKIIEDYDYEVQEILYQYRYVAEKIKSYGIEDVESFYNDIKLKKEELEENEEDLTELRDIYKTLSKIKYTIELTNNKKYLYGTTLAKDEDIVIRDDDNDLKKEEQNIDSQVEERKREEQEKMDSKRENKYIKKVFKL